MNAASESKLTGVVRVDTTIPEDLDTAQAKLCYLALATTGPATLDDLQHTIDEGKLTLLDVLGTLTDRGHVERDDRGRYATC